MKYRADVDGLRTIAIIPVLLFHAGISLFSGGYVGVDVFFVISGYLITSVIISDINNHSFSIANFYVKRIKRIFPALFSVILATWVIFSLFMVYVPNFKDLTQSVGASIFFSSNILFWKENGYFDMASELKPLLHTWSLGIEEQFYIFYPLLLVFVSKYLKKKYVSVILVFIALSFTINIWATEYKISSAFYLLPARAWELGIGCMIALWGKPVSKSKQVLNITGIIGVVFIFFAIFYFDHTTKFPGAWAAIPCLGTALIIISGMGENKSIITSILEHKIPVYIGRLSYSLYLWHFPIFTFRKFWENELGRSFFLTNTFLFVVTIALSYLSYRYIETPARKFVIYNRSRLFAVTVSVMCLFLIAAFAVNRVNGRLPWNHPVELENEYISELGYFGYDKLEFGDKFIIGDKAEIPGIAIWGDSHAAVASIGIEELAKDNNKSIFIATNPGTMPVLDMIKGGTTRSFDVDSKKQSEIYNLLINHDEIKSVILIARWGWAYSEEYIKDESYTMFRLKDYVANSENDNRRIFKQMLEKTIKKLNDNGKDVYVFTDVPSYKRYLNFYFLPECISEADYEHEIQSFVDDIDDIKSRTPVTLIKYHEKLLENGKYCFSKGRKSYYLDDDHLTRFGSILLANRNKDILDEIFTAVK